MRSKRSRGIRFINRETISAITLKHGIPVKGKPEILRVNPRDATVVTAERNGTTQQVEFRGDVRPQGCDILSHGTVKLQTGYASRIVVTLRSGTSGGCHKQRQRLYYTAKRYSFRVYPLRDDNGDETNVYTLAVVSEAAIAFLTHAVWVDALEETAIRLQGNGSIEHIARKPKRKRSSYHPDYADNQWENHFGRAASAH